MTCLTGGVELDVQHALGDDAPFAGAREAGILDRVLEEEDDLRLRSLIAVVNQNRASPKKIAVALDRQIDRRVEQRMAGTDECRQRLARRRDERLLERDTLVAGQDRLADAD